MGNLNTALKTKAYSPQERGIHLEIQRTLNGKPITREELSKLEITNPTLERIMASVQQRYSLPAQSFKGIKTAPANRR